MNLKYIKAKYVLSEPIHYQLRNIRPDVPIKDHFYSLSLDGLLLIDRGYGYDGPSGPTIDTPCTMFCSLIHDVMYEMFRKEQLPSHWRAEADDELADIGVACGAGSLRMKIWQLMVRRFAGACASPKNRKKMYVVPAIERLELT